MVWSAKILVGPRFLDSWPPCEHIPDCRQLKKWGSWLPRGRAAKQTRGAWRDRRSSIVQFPTDALKGFKADIGKGGKDAVSQLERHMFSKAYSRNTVWGKGLMADHGKGRKPGNVGGEANVYDS